jgi:hypothetical protein
MTWLIGSSRLAVRSYQYMPRGEAHGDKLAPACPVWHAIKKTNPCTYCIIMRLVAIPSCTRMLLRCALSLVPKTCLDGGSTNGSLLIWLPSGDRLAANVR